LFWQNGYAATSVRELSTQLGIQKASLYHHIDSKEGLLYEVCIVSLGDIEARARIALDTEVDPLSRLRALILAHVNSISQEREMHATMLTELRSLSPKHKVEVIRRRDAYEIMIKSVLESCQDAGSIRVDIPARLLARCLLNLLNWSIFWFDPAGKMSTHELAEVLVSVFLQGALPAFLRPAPASMRTISVRQPNPIGAIQTKSPSRQGREAVKVRRSI
jgi:AcrR family transcriptional regulator